MRRMKGTSPVFAVLFFVCGVARVFAATEVAQDIRDLRALRSWHESEVNATDPPDQTCGVNVGGDTLLRLDMQLPPGISNRDANAQIGALDRKVTSFLATHGWSVMKVALSGGGIPDLTRCSQKQTAIAQIYKTTGRCTMGSPCTVYDGFAVVLYLPKIPAQVNSQRH